MGRVRAGDDTEPGVVAQQVEGALQGGLGVLDAIARHRLRAVDQQRLDQGTGGSDGRLARGRDADDRVDLAGARGEGLGLRGLDREGGHCEDTPEMLAALSSKTRTAALMLSWPSWSRACWTRARATTRALAPRGCRRTTSARCQGSGREFHRPSVQSTSRPGP